jgi:uncharacterized RDD family membrane protein YckC
MHCKHCGSKIDNDSKFCQSCGGKVEPIGHPMSSIDQPVTDNSGMGQDIFTNVAQKTNPRDDTLTQELIEQNQADPVHAQYKYAGFWLRFCAYWIDFVILFIIGSIFLAIIDYPVQYDAEGPFYLFGFAFMLVNNPFSLFMSWLYFALMESSSNQGTVGKMALNIKVTDLNGEKIKFGRATGRHFGKLLSGVILGIGYLMAGFTSQKQSFHDMMANCLVLRK